MGVFFSSWYGIILILWGLVFEAVGAYAMWVIYHWTQRDQRQMTISADEAAAMASPAVATGPAPVAARREQPHRAA